MGGNGAVAPHAAMTKTGHQAQRNVVNPADTDADVVTAFHPDSETERTLLFGSNFVEVQPSTANSTFGSSQTFTFSNDVDAIGDVYCRVQVDFGTVTAAPQPDALLRIIERVEVMVGNSTWQTMENADVRAMAMTMTDYGAAAVIRAQAGGRYFTAAGNSGLAGFGAGAVTGAATAEPGLREAWFPLNIFTAGGPARAHLVAGAPHQSFRIKLTYATKAVVVGSSSTDQAQVDNPKVELWARQHIMTNFERDQIRSNTIAKSLYLTQHMERTVTSETAVSVECDSFSLLASHLLITLESDKGLVGVNVERLVSAELLLNTSSHSGELDAGFMLAATGSSMGLKPTLFLSSNNDPGDIDGSSPPDRITFVHPIAATPWGPDGCPFNRFDTIRLRLKFSDSFSGKISVTCCGTASAVYAKQAASLQYHS